jgi:hypothetical protein
MRLFSHIPVKLIVLFSIVSLPLAAQEQDLLKSILKESLKPDLLMELKPISLDSAFLKKQIIFDVNKAPLPIATFNPKLDSLINNYDLPFQEINTLAISPNLFMPYTNPKRHDPVDKMNGYIELKPRPDAGATQVMISPIVLAGVAIKYLMEAGVIPNKPDVSKKSKKEKALRAIKEVYQIED